MWLMTGKKEEDCTIPQERSSNSGGGLNITEYAAWVFVDDCKSRAQERFWACFFLCCTFFDFVLRKSWVKERRAVELYFIFTPFAFQWCLFDWNMMKNQGVESSEWKTISRAAVILFCLFVCLHYWAAFALNHNLINYVTFQSLHEYRLWSDKGRNIEDKWYKNSLF